MKRSEEAALMAYPKRKDGRKRYYNCTDDDIRRLYAKGYKKAEKDCALTWKDVQAIFRIADNYESELNRPKYLTQEYCEEVLHRFNQIKEEEK